MGKRSRSKREERFETAEFPPPSTTVAIDPEQKLIWAICIALIVGVFLVYGQVASHDFVNYDDPDYVLSNPHVSSGLSPANIGWAFTTFHASNWHPLTWLSHMTDVSLFGMNAGAQLLINVLLHALSCVLLFLLLQRMTARRWPSALVAALFALHPLHVESVAWVAERKDVLSTLLFLLTLWLYVTWTRSRTSASYAWMIAAFALGLMAKPMLVTLPFVLLLLDWWPLGRVSVNADDASTTHPSKLVVEKLPLFALVIPSVILTLVAQQQVITPVALPLRLANVLLSYVEYLGKMLVPIRLAAFYPYRTSASAALTIGAALLLLAITRIAIRHARRFPYLLMGWLWYLGTLVPVIGLVQVGQQSLADRYTYIPLIGIFIAIVWLLADLAPSRVPQATLTAIAGVVLFILAALTFVQVGYWKNSVTLFQHALTVTTNNRIAHENLGSALLHDLDYPGAEREYHAAIGLNPHSDVAHSGLGSALAGAGDAAGAERELRAALAINPHNLDAMRALGRQLSASGRSAEAATLLEKASGDHDPRTLAALAVARGNVDEAISQYQQAIAAEPKSADLRNDIAAMLARAGRDQEALGQYQAALQLAPHQYDARMNLGALLSRIGRDPEAVDQFAAAAQERPRSPEPHVYMALVSANGGHLPEAAAEVQKAIAIDPVLANSQFTNAVHVPFKPTNLQEYLALLQQKH